MAKLTQFAIKHASPGRHSDGNGLYLLVSPTGTKSWVLRIQVDGRRRDFGLGSLSLVGLHEAREKALKWRRLAKDGIDPSVETKGQKSTVPTFEDAALTYHESVRSSWKNPKHRSQWINTLRTYAFPVIGKLPVDQIDAAEIKTTLIPIWQSKAETARRVRQRIRAVLDYSCAMGWRGSDAPMRAVNTLLKPLKQPKRGHFAAMPITEVPPFVERLEASRPSAGRLALMFLILTAARSGEVRGARWSEIDRKRSLWIVPAERMKMGREHIVPLSSQALKILEKAEPLASNDDGLIFPGLRRRPLSDMTLGKVLKDNGGTGLTVHGFRSTFRDWAAETGYNNDWAEAALAHAVSNRVEAAYRRTQFVDQRKAMMQKWADYCSPASDRFSS